MKITIEPTQEICVINGVRCRAWRGVTDKGVDCVVFIATIAISLNAAGAEEAAAAFSKELTELFPTVKVQTVDHLERSDLAKPSVN